MASIFTIQGGGEKPPLNILDNIEENMSIKQGLLHFSFFKTIEDYQEKFIKFDKLKELLDKFFPIDSFIF